MLISLIPRQTIQASWRTHARNILRTAYLVTFATQTTISVRIAIFPTPVYWTPRWGSSAWNFVMAVALQKARHDPNRWWKEIDDSLTTYDLCSIITHRIVAYVQLINAFWSNHGFQLNLANDPSVTFHLKRGTVYPSNHPLHLATAGASDSALMLASVAVLGLGQVGHSLPTPATGLPT